MDGGRSRSNPDRPPSGEDQRESGDRRCGRDRRGTGKRNELSTDQRPYGFRDFGERRCKQDRRLYGIDDVWSRAADQPDEPTPSAGGQKDPEVRTLVTLTNAELRALLKKSDH